MPEKEPKKKAAKKTAPKKAEHKIEPEKKTATKKSAKKIPETAALAGVKKRVAKTVEKPEVVKETAAPVTRKMEESPEESKIEAAKFYPAQISEKNGKKKEASVPVAERRETDIPGRYYDDKVVLMARDPYWCYAYWDISGALMAEKTAAAKKDGSYKMVLRIYDVTDVVFNGDNAHKYIDIEVTGDANNWYINVWAAGRTYVADLGLKTASGRFILIARSNAVGTPSDKVSDKVDEDWMEVGEEFEEIMRMSGGNGHRMGGSEGFQGINISGMTSGVVSSFSSPAYKIEKEKGFFLWADTELILYGATEKDARLTVKGEVVQLKADGSFSLRFHLPDGTIGLPIEAVSSDGQDKKSINISVQRKTEK